MSKPDGGPAFPVEANAGYGPCEGMTLRDYFAAKGMAAIISSEQQMRELAREHVGRPLAILGDVAAVSYAMADAMLIAREK